MRSDDSFKPIGAALTAVVAGLAPGMAAEASAREAQPAPVSQPAPEARAPEPVTFALPEPGPPVEPFGDKPAGQGDLFSGR